MESKHKIEMKTDSERLQNMVNSLTKCKVDFITEKEECKKLKEVNSKLELELKETRELEKSHRYHLQNSREMIENLQETVSQLVYLKRDVKKIRDEIVSKDINIASLEKDKENTQHNYNESIAELRKAHEGHIEELISINDRKVEQVRYDSDTKIAQFTCVIEELRSKLKDLEQEHRDKMNVVVLEYEEKIQRSAVEVTHLQEQLRMQTARTDANIDVYRRKLEDLEEKLKQNQFKEYLAHSNYPTQSAHSQFENRVERPYSSRSDYTDTSEFNSIPVRPSPKPIPNQAPNRNSKTPTLQVTYQDNRTQNVRRNEKKGIFNITKKRKLYNEKDFLNQ
ncbi:uncharacterized protein LOC120624522 [Pararge aegeria]|uniref:uncharacterized protein LOC120624522 n=1 Tax=Pararge aegeria TaxID=116150 RepID=UPI0019D04A44|nr:uncharacterized protein LOC120624522 [Pararge aegeria]